MNHGVDFLRAQHFGHVPDVAQLTPDPGDTGNFVARQRRIESDDPMAQFGERTRDRKTDKAARPGYKNVLWRHR